MMIADAKEALFNYFTYAFKLIDVILKTPSERLVYINKHSIIRICDKSFLPSLLIFCFDEAIRREQDKETVSFVQREMILAINKYVSSIKSLLKEWDVLTDIITMQEIERFKESIQETGDLPAGTKGFKEVMNGLGFEA